MKLRHLFIWLAILPVFIFFGCIPVEDLGGYWENGILDKELAGHWKQSGTKYKSQDKYISFIKSGDAYSYESIDVEYTYLEDDDIPKPQVKCISIDGFRFMVVRFPEPEFDALNKSEDSGKKNDDDFGCIQLYKIKGNTLTLLHLRQTVLAEAIKKKKIEGIIREDDIPGYSINVLNDKTFKSIAHMASKPKNVERRVKYERVDNIEQSLKESKTYPSTNDTLKNTEVNISTPDLKYFAQGKTDILLSHLQASPEWKMYKKRDEIICHRRFRHQGEWRDGSNGFWSGYGDDNDTPWRIGESQEFQSIRYLIRFSKKPFGFHAVWAKADHIMTVDPLAGRINVKLKLSDQGTTSYIAIGQEGLWFEFHERTKKERRVYTRNAIKWLNDFLGTIRKSEKEVKEKGYVSSLIPAYAIRTGNPNIKVEDGMQPGIYDISAWINPGEQGYVYLRVFDSKSNKELSADTLSWRSKEYIGFSKQPDTLFLYSCSATIYEGDWDHSYDARFELWFHPEDESPEVKLIEHARKIFGWER